MQQVLEYTQRQNDIDKLLQPNVVRDILNENWDEISKSLSKDKRMISIIYPSTQSLLRRIKGGNEKPMYILHDDTIEQGLREHSYLSLIHISEPTRPY